MTKISKHKRTEFGMRVLRARKSAKMTQIQLAAAVGCSQSNIVEAEYRAGASTLTVSIARATGVDAVWLDKGIGEMFSNSLESPPVPNISLTDAPSPSDVIRALARLLEPLSAPKRRAIGSLLQSLIDDPALSDSVIPDISYLIGSKTDLSALAPALRKGAGRHQS